MIALPPVPITTSSPSPSSPIPPRPPFLRARLELVLASGLGSPSPGFDAQTLRRLIAVLEDRPVGLTPLRIFLATDPADMRRKLRRPGRPRSTAPALDPLSGHLFVFLNKPRDRIKILYWDRDGLAIWYKKHE